jgi:hypothetical protein
MNSTVIIHRPPMAPRARTLPTAPATPAFAESSSASVAEREERRWLSLLVPPFIISSLFLGATIGTGTLWLLAPTMVFGPFLLILAFIYLSITSDSNGSDEPR